MAPAPALRVEVRRRNPLVLLPEDLAVSDWFVLLFIFLLFECNLYLFLYPPFLSGLMLVLRDLFDIFPLLYWNVPGFSLWIWT